MSNAAQTRSGSAGTTRARRLTGRGGGVLLASFLMLPTAAGAATGPALHVPAQAAVAASAGSPVPAPSAPAARVAGASASRAGAVSHASSAVSTPAPPVARPTTTTGPTVGSSATGAAPQPSPGPATPVPAPKLEPPKVSSLPAPPVRAGHTLPKLSRPQAPTPQQQVQQRASGPAPAPASVPVTVSPTRRLAGPVSVPAAVPVAHRPSPRYGARVGHGTGGVPARTASVSPPIGRSGRAASTAPAHTTAVVSPHAGRSATGFVLVPGERAADFGTPANGPNSLTSVLAPLVAGPSLGGGGALTWLLLPCVGALLIALLCLDAIGVGPRHDYLRRRQGRTWRLPPWR